MVMHHHDHHHHRQYNTLHHHHYHHNAPHPQYWKVAEAEVRLGEAIASRAGNLKAFEVRFCFHLVRIIVNYYIWSISFSIRYWHFPKCTNMKITCRFCWSSKLRCCTQIIIWCLWSRCRVCCQWRWIYDHHHHIILLTTERGDRGVWQADGSTSERWQVLEFETGARILFYLSFVTFSILIHSHFHR